MLVYFQTSEYYKFSDYTTCVQFLGSRLRNFACKVCIQLFSFLCAGSFFQALEFMTLLFVSTGSYPGAEDLAPYVQVGQRTTWTFDHLDMASGITCIATVRGN